MLEAVPDIDYRFVKWSDNNSVDPMRTDLNVTAAVDAISLFEQHIFTVIYNTSGSDINHQYLSLFGLIHYGREEVTVPEPIPNNS